MTFVMLEVNEAGVPVEKDKKKFNQSLCRINSVAYFSIVMITCTRCIVLSSVNEYLYFLH